MNFYLSQVLNGISFGMLLFMSASGLSLIFGLLKTLNLTHGSFYLFGGYIGLSVLALTGSFIAAAVVAGLAVALLGIVIERVLLRPLHMQELPQVLLTFGLLLIFSDLALVFWGGHPQMVPKPVYLSRSVEIGPISYPSYRLFLVCFGLLVAAFLWWFQDRTRLGAMVRAGVDNEEIASALGINVSLLFSLVFGLGAFLAALGGFLGGPIVGVYPGADFDILMLGFVVITIGGIGSLRGALVGSVLVGMLDNFGKVLFPELALFTIFAPMAMVLALRPTGLFGRE